MAPGGRLTAAEATCPICLCVLVRPVTPPCRHTLCLPCFEATVEQASLACPLCRQRISVWLRRARRAGRLLDERLWARLRRDFPDQVQARLDGREADLSEQEPAPVPLHLSAPGEIREEYERELASALTEEQERRAAAERASTALIQQLRRETEQREQQERQDELLARGMTRDEQRAAAPPPRAGDGAQKKKKHRPAAGTPIRGPMDVYVGQMTPRNGGKLLASPCVVISPLGTGKENSDPAASVRERAAATSGSGDWAQTDCVKQGHRIPPSSSRPRPAAAEGAAVRGAHSRNDRPTKRRSLSPEYGLDSTALPAKRRAPSPEYELGSAALPRAASPEYGLDSTALPAKRRAPSPEYDLGSAALSAERRAPSPEYGLDSTALPAKRRAPSPEYELGSAALPRAASPELDLTSAALLAEQLEAERLLELERADRRLAEQLQRELNTVPPVDRSKGSADAYSLRGGGGPRRGRPRSQLSLEESLGRRHLRSGTQ